jgi:multiple sugar transport system ATP-binding protein
VSAIQLNEVSKVYPGGDALAVDDVTLEIADGEFMVLVGPSGCGKSTLLRMIAGLEDVTYGSIDIGDTDVTDMEPGDRDVAMVFQNYALYPHLSVRANIGFSLKVRKADKAEAAARVETAAKSLGLVEYLDRKPSQLSGGQRQRVAMGRAMVRDPKVYLMDEPLSNLDAQLRVAMRAELARLHDQLGVTTVFVTHDQVEALTLGTRVAVMRRGVLQQCDTPENIFANPANTFVAGFIGSPPMNLLAVDVHDGAAWIGDTPVAIDHAIATKLNGTSAVLGLRPADLVPADRSMSPDTPVLRVVPDVVERLGTETHVIFDVDARPVVVQDLTDLTSHLTDVGGGAKRAVMTARLDADVQVSTGEPLDLVVRESRGRLFSADDGRRIEA